MFRMRTVILVLCLLLILNYMYKQPPKSNSPAQSLAAEQSLKLTDASVDQKLPNLAPQAASAILIEATTGKILYQKNMHKRLPPASVTKVMTMLLAVEAIDNKQVRLDEIVRVSENAARADGTSMYLEPGYKYSFDEMLKGLMLESANDAAVALAEHMARSEQAFVDLMNVRAKQLGMNDSKFANPNGLQVKDEWTHHVSSAYDIALMSRELLKHDRVLGYTSLKRYFLMQNNGKMFKMDNSNHMLGVYKGMDGLKTGFTDTAKHCLVATAKRDGMRLIAVVLGEPNKPTRTIEMTALLDYGFQNYKFLTFVKKGSPLGAVPVYKGVREAHLYEALNDYGILLKKTDNVRDFDFDFQFNDSLSAPVKPTDRAGTLRILKNGKVYEQFDLPVQTSVARAHFWQLFESAWRKLLFVEST